MRIFVDKKLTKDQAGFGPGRSFAGQLLNLTQHIEDGYESNMLIIIIIIIMAEMAVV